MFDGYDNEWISDKVMPNNDKYKVGQRYIVKSKKGKNKDRIGTITMLPNLYRSKRVGIKFEDTKRENYHDNLFELEPYPQK